MSIQSEINRITGSRDQSFTALSNKGVSIQSGSTIDDLPGYIAALPETIKGAGVPTTSTAGLVGQHYFNTSATESPYEYVCTDATGGVYTWEPFAEKGETGDSGVYYGTTTPTDPDVTVWIDPSGTGISIPTKTSDLDNDVPFMSMGLGETVPVNSDLNNYTTPGVYYVPTGSEAAQILNSPITTSGYRLEVKRTTGTLGRIQIAYANVGNTAIYARTLSIPASEWGAWAKIGQKAINLTVGDADSGITSFRRAVYDPNSSTVRVYVSARNMSANILTTNVLGVIPDGYRPSTEATLMGFFTAADGSAHSYIGRVQTDGSIRQNLGNTVRQVLLVGEYIL